MFDDGQAKTGSAGVSRPVLVNAVKTLENMGLVAERDTHAIVVHTNLNGIPIAANLESHSNGRLATVLQRVVHQIVKCLLYPKGVGLNPWRTLRCVDRHCGAEFSDPRIQPIKNPGNAFEKIDWFKAKADFSGLQLRNRQKIFDQ